MTDVTFPVHGPFGWPKFNTDLPALPDIPGVYLMTLEHGSGFIPFGVGITRRPMRKRFVEHTRSYMTGKYNILELDAALQGERMVAWKGWDWSPAKQAIFDSRKNEIMALAAAQLAATRIFIIETGVAPRLLERIEGALANHFYKTGGTLIDLGMLCMPRWSSEAVMHANF